MSKHIRQKITHAIQTTFRPAQGKPSSTKSKIPSCCFVPKPNDYEYIPYEPKPTTRAVSNSNYVDLSDCHSWSSSSSSSRDSGISSDTHISSVSTSNRNCHQLHSTRTMTDESCSLSTISDLSSIPHPQMNISHFDVTAWHPVPTSFECCHCHCHHPVDNDAFRQSNNYLYVPQQHLEPRSKKQFFPYIF